jgi:hypothetical protein
MLGFDQGPLEVSRRGQLFFQPLELHVEPTDLLVEFGLEGLALVVLAATAVTEERLGAVEELLLPLTDLDRVDLKGVGQLGQDPGLLGGLQGDPSLEGRGISLACTRDDAPRDGSETFDQFNIPSGPVSGVHLNPRSVPRGNDDDTPPRQAAIILDNGVLKSPRTTLRRNPISEQDFRRSLIASFWSSKSDFGLGFLDFEMTRRP